MIEQLSSYARDNWPAWFGRAANSLHLALGSGGPAHRTRAAVFVFEERRRRPSVVMKIAFTDLEAGFLQHEHEALTRLGPLLPSTMRSTVPDALGLTGIEGNTVFTMGALAGRRLLVPDLGGEGGRVPRSLLGDFYRKSFQWSSDLATATSGRERLDGTDLAAIIDRFSPSEWGSTGEAGARLAGFRQAVADSGISWSTCWQHADLAVGNVLLHRGELRLLDWEHASDRAMPWFDITQSPGATARLAKRQSGAPSSRDAAMAALGRTGWAGEVLRHEMKAAWRQPLPLGWAVALASMATAIRQSDDIRMGAEDWTEFALALLADDELRAEVPWMVPEW